jgi:tetratricopeptide (TPR) repeat protein
MKFFLISLFLVATFLSWAQTPDDILELANKYRQEGKYQQSYQSYVEAAVLLEASKKSEDMLKALTAALRLAIVLSQPRDAKKHLQRIFASENAYGQRPWFGDVYYFAGQYYHYYTDYSDSSSHFFQRSLRLRQSVLTAFDVKIAQSLIGLADVERLRP